MLSRQVRAASIAFVTLAVIVAGCHTVPLGDPEKSVMDPKLVGWWISEKPEKTGMLVRVMAYDKRTYVVTAYGYDAKAEPVKPDGKFTNKAWLTTVGGMEVMTLQIIDPEWDAASGADAAARYSYERIKKHDDWIEMTMLNTDFLKDTKTPAELEKKIADNVNSAELWKNSEPMVFKRVDDKMDEVTRILKAFEPRKGE